MFGWTAVVATVLIQAVDTQQQQVQDLVLVPELRIGGLDSPDASFGRITSLTVDGAGRLYVADGLARSISIFDPDGRHEGSIGRRGNGPGEFQAPTLMGWLDDRLWVQDMVLRRVTFFEATGKAVETHNYATTPYAGGRFMPTPPGALLEDGTVVIQPGAGLRELDLGLVPEYPVLRVDPAGDVLDTLTHIPADRSWLVLNERGHVLMSSFQPFSDVPLWSARPDGKSLVLVKRDVSERNGEAQFSVVQINAGGDTSFVVRYGYNPVPVEKQLVDRLLGEQSERLGGPDGMFPSPQAADRALREAVYLPRYHPPVTELVVGGDGSVWIRREDRGGAEVLWNVLDTTGRIVAAVHAPAGVQLKHVDRNRAWGIEYDELGVPYVLRFQVEPRRTLGHEASVADPELNLLTARISGQSN